MSPQIASSDPECLFCKICNGEIPCARVFENNQVFAFLDINPAAKGHTLVVPKFHVPTLLELPNTFADPLISALKQIGGALMTEVGADGFNCFQNNFHAAGQVIFHVHWHLIPRFTADNLFTFPPGNPLSQDEMQHLAASLHSRIG